MRDRRVGVRVEEHVAVIERGNQSDVLRQQHAVAEHVARHVADADHGELVGVGVLADHASVAANALPRAASGDAHLLVVVAVAAARGERVTEPEVVLGCDVVGDVAERGGALVGCHDEVRVVGVVDDHIGGMHDAITGDVVGDVEQTSNEPAVAIDALGPHGIAIRRVG